MSFQGSARIIPTHCRSQPSLPGHLLSNLQPSLPPRCRNPNIRLHSRARSHLHRSRIRHHRSQRRRDRMRRRMRQLQTPRRCRSQQSPSRPGPTPRVPRLRPFQSLCLCSGRPSSLLCPLASPSYAQTSQARHTLGQLGSRHGDGWPRWHWRTRRRHLKAPPLL